MSAPEFELSGAKLCTLTQARAYLSIKEWKARTPRPATTRMLERALERARQMGRPEAIASDVWRTLRHKDIQRKVVDFIWKTVHDAHRVGKYWSKIPGYEERGLCKVCRVEDNIEHILIHCRASGRGLVWRFVERLWAKAPTKY